MAYKLASMMLMLNAASILMVASAANKRPSSADLSALKDRVLQSSPPTTWVVPWQQPQGQKFPYTGLHNQLDELLKVQASEGKWVSTFMYTLGARPLLLNCIFSYLNFGGSTSYIVGALTEAALEDCISLNLACYNATYMIRGYDLHDQNNQSSHVDFGAAGFTNIGWTKIELGLAILERGYNIHVSDVDLVFLRSIWPSVHGILYQRNGDATLASEEFGMLAQGPANHTLPDRYFNLLNIGGMWFYSNNRTRTMFAAWLDHRLEAQDQVVLNNRVHEWAGLCTTWTECYIITKRLNKVSIVKHPSFHPHYRWNFDAGAMIEPCQQDDRLLYYHVLGVRGLENKYNAFKKLKLWFLSQDDVHSTVVNTSHPWLAGNLLPCRPPNDRAWARPLPLYFD